MSQQTQRKFSPCYRKCGQMVTYSEQHKSASGKHIPMVEVIDAIGQKSLIAHDCPLWKKQPQQQPTPTTTTTTTTTKQQDPTETEKKMRYKSAPNGSASALGRVRAYPKIVDITVTSA